MGGEEGRRGGRGRRKKSRKCPFTWKGRGGLTLYLTFQSVVTMLKPKVKYSLNYCIFRSVKILTEDNVRVPEGFLTLELRNRFLLGSISVAFSHHIYPCTWSPPPTPPIQQQVTIDLSRSIDKVCLTYSFRKVTKGLQEVSEGPRSQLPFKGMTFPGW